jgi:hypothetical protein
MDPALEAKMRAEAMARVREAFPDASQGANPIRDQEHPELANTLALARLAEHVKNATENLDAALLRLEELHDKNDARIADIEKRLAELEKTLAKK